MVKRFSTVYLFNSDLDLSGVSTLTNPRHDILGVRFDCKLTFETHVRGVVPRVFQRIGILSMVNDVVADT